MSQQAIMEFFKENKGRYTAYEIADKINASHFNMHAKLRKLSRAGLVRTVYEKGRKNRYEGVVDGS